MWGIHTNAAIQRVGLADARKPNIHRDLSYPVGWAKRIVPNIPRAKRMARFALTNLRSAAFIRIPRFFYVRPAGRTFPMRRIEPAMLMKKLMARRCKTVTAVIYGGKPEEGVTPPTPFPPQDLA
ncbi:MAG: hypothetical protein Q8O79_07420 [Pseudomonadota bacterium]|nr:hypothetical protein [Pseudomonadota bacterium]